MNTSKTFIIKHRVYLIFAAITAIAFTFFQTYLLNNFYDTDVFLFQDGANMPSTIYTALLVCVFLTATSIIVFRKEKFLRNINISESNTLMTFIGMFTGLVFLVLIAMYVYNFITGTYDFNIKLHMGLKYISVIFALPSAIYFMIIALKKNPYKSGTAVFGLCVVIWAIFNLMGEYFNMNTPLNDPVRILHQISYITIMLFYLYEAGYSADIRKPVLYHMFGYILIIFTTISAVPPIFMNLTGLKEIHIDTMSCYVEICLMLFAVCRMILVKSVKIYESEEANEWDATEVAENVDKIIGGDIQTNEK